MTPPVPAISRLCASLALAAVLLPGAYAADLDLSDCDILSGKKSAAAFKNWSADNHRRAEAGDQDAIRHRAAAAMNRLACLEEAETGDEGWSSIATSGDGEAEISEPAGIANIAGKPAALKALKDAVRYTHQAGAFDPGYRNASAETVAQYAAALPELIEQAYGDAAGTYAFDCVLKRTHGKRDGKTACIMARNVRARLTPKVPAARRTALDTAGRAWAEQVGR